jgi:hypothetical protein
MSSPLRSFLAAALLASATLHSHAAAISVKEAFSLPESEVESSIVDSHPSIAIAYASRLFDGGRKDDAVTWFYIGQLRYRFRVMANPEASPDGDSALMSSLNATIGHRINEWAGGSPQGWVRSIDKALAWDASHPDKLTSREQYGPQWQQVRTGLERLRGEIEKNADSIRELRAKNGAENR